MSAETTAAMRIYTADLPAETVSGILGVEPTLVQCAGAIRPGGRRWRRHLWCLEAPEIAGEDLDSKIGWLLSTLAPQRQAIRDLVESAMDAELLLWCACFAVDPETTLVLRPETSAEIAAFGAQLHLSVYAVEE